MESPEIEDFIFELRKINAIKISRTQKITAEKNLSEKTKDGDESFPSKISIGLKQDKKRDEDKKKIDLFVHYRIPSVADFELEIDAEFIGLVFLKQPLDIEQFEIEKNSSEFKEFMDNQIIPRVLRELDKTLIPIFKSMDVKYEKLVEKTGEDS